MEIDELLHEKSPARASHNSNSAQATKRAQSGQRDQVMSSNTSQRGRGRGRPPGATGLAKKRLTGSKRAKLQYQEFLSSLGAAGPAGPDADHVINDLEICPYKQRCKYGFLARVKSNLDSIDDQGTREAALFVFEKGVRALDLRELSEKSVEWLHQSAVPEYIDLLKNKNTPAAENKLNAMSPADHIICIL